MIVLPEGFTARPAVMADLEAAVDLFNTCAIALTGKPQLKKHEVQSEWKSAALNLAADTCVILTPDKQLVGYIEIWDFAPHVRMIAWARVHPEYKKRGLGTYLDQWAEQRTQQAIPNAPEHARVVIRQRALLKDTDAQEFFKLRGYTLVRYYLRMIIEMDAPPPTPRIPDGLTIRHTDDGEKERRAAYATIHEAFKDHWGHVERPFEEEYETWKFEADNNPDYDPTLYFLALDNASGEIAGALRCTAKTAEDPEMGQVAPLCVRRPWRRRGLALSLLHHAFGELYKRGTRKICLDVDADSLTGATRLYEKAGMYTERRWTYYEKELRSGKDLSTQNV